MAKKDVKHEGPSGLDRLKAQLKSGELEHLYFFYGEERFLRDHYLTMLQDKLLEGPTRDFNFHRLDADHVDLRELADAVDALPMMAQSSLVQVEDWELHKLPEADLKALVEILSDIPDYCTVVFLFDTVEFHVDTSEKADERKKKLQEVKKLGLPVEFVHQSRRELNGWIRRHFKIHGKEIGDRQCEYLSFLTGGDMTTLLGEIDKIAAYVSGEVITEADIAAVVTPVLDAQVFDLTDAIAEGDYEKALVKLRTLLQMQEEPIPLLAAIGGQLRRLMYAKVAIGAGRGESGVAELMKAASGRAPHPYVLQKTITMSRRVTEQFCARAITLCLETDASLKSFSGDDQRTMELLLLRLAQEARRG